MSLTYAPSSEPLHISAKWLFSDRATSGDTHPAVPREFEVHRLYITQLKAQGPAGTCTKSREEKEEEDDHEYMVVDDRQSSYAAANQRGGGERAVEH